MALALGCRAPPIPATEVFPAHTGLEARYVTVDGTRIRYVDTGRGPAVVLLHGIAASIYAWRNNIGPIASAGFRVVAFDNRGFGFSGKPATGYANAAYAHVLETFMDSLRLVDAVLVGHSMGGAIAAEFAIAHPNRVRGLVLIDAAGFGVAGPLVLRAVGWPVVGQILGALRGWRATGRILKSTYADPRKVRPEDVDQYYAPVADPEFGRSLARVLREFRFDGLRGRLSTLNTPTLVLWGEEDRWIPPRLGRELARELPRVAFLTVAHAGHALPEEVPEEVNRLVIAFLKHGVRRLPPDLAAGAGRSGGIDFINRLVEESGHVSQAQ